MGMVAKGLYDCCMDDYYMEERSSGLANFSKTMSLWFVKGGTSLMLLT